MANAKRQRVVDIKEFYVGYLTTALQSDELLTEVRHHLLEIANERIGEGRVREIYFAEFLVQ